MSIYFLKDFMKTYISKNGGRDDSDLQEFYIYKKHPRDSKLNSDKGFLKKDNANKGEPIGFSL